MQLNAQVEAIIGLFKTKNIETRTDKVKKLTDQANQARASNVVSNLFFLVGSQMDPVCRDQKVSFGCFAVLFAILFAVRFTVRFTNIHCIRTSLSSSDGFGDQRS